MSQAVLDRAQESDDCFEEALAMHERLDAPFFIARTKLAWGEALLRRPGPTPVRHGTHLLAEARELARAHGYANIERWATTAGRRPRPRPASS